MPLPPEPLSAPRAPLAIAVFARAPVAGATKTRLIPRLGADGAARLQEQLIERALTRATAVVGAAVSLWVAGDVAHPFVADAAGRHGVALYAQQGLDLGERMAHAFAALLHDAERAVLIGTDCPAMTVDDLHDAAAALDINDVVVQPALDGGYVLIALGAPQPQLFAGIAWGSALVLEQTMARAAELGLTVGRARPLPDLDTPEDHAHALAQGWIDAVLSRP
jgi:rSAM/selenodomain-associated transferase 1